MEERIVAPDPVTEPDAYAQALLDLLGGQDPLEVMAATPHTYRERTDGLSEEILRKAPAPDEWSLEQLLAHFWHGEIVASFRWRVILAQDHPTIVGYDQDAWNDLPRPGFHEMLDAFTSLRAANIVLIRDTPETEWDRVGRHEERGDESFRTLVTLIAGHDIAHLKQLDQTLAAVTS